MSAGAFRKLLVLVPCYNEEKNILSVVRGIKKSMARAKVPYGILVVDDGSSDRSVEKAGREVTVLSLPVNSGVETALHAGYVYALENGFDACLHVDGDGQHPPEEIPRLIRAQQDSGCDMVLASRYLQSKGFRSSLIRQTGMRMITVMTRLRTGLTVTDPTSGFKLIAGPAMRRFALSSPVDYPEPVSLSLLTHHRYTYREIPVVMRPRRHGRSYLNPVTSLIYMIKVSLRLAIGA